MLTSDGNWNLDASWQHYERDNYPNVVTTDGVYVIKREPIDEMSDIVVAAMRADYPPELYTYKLDIMCSLCSHARGAYWLDPDIICEACKQEIGKVKIYGTVFAIYRDMITVSTGDSFFRCKKMIHLT